MSKTRILLIYGITILILLLLFVLPAVQGPTKCYRYYGSMANLKMMGIALITYAEDHKDVFPEDIKQLSALFDHRENVLESPCKPKDFKDPSYIYISGHSFKDAKAKEKYIIAYENPEYLTGYEFQKIIVTYLDGSVDRLKKEEFLSKLKATYEHLGKPMPEIKFKDKP